jgi:hypothetical protein
MYCYDLSVKFSEWSGPGEASTHEDAEHGVVVVVFQLQVFLETSQSCVACISSAKTSEYASLW